MSSFGDIFLEFLGIFLFIFMMDLGGEYNLLDVNWPHPSSF